MAQSIDAEPSAASSSAHAATTNGRNGFSTSAEAAAAAVKYTDAMDYDDEHDFKPLWDGSEIDRREFVRLTLQALEEMGYGTTASALKSESGFSLESSTVSEFRKGILAGKWDLVERLLQELPADDVTDLKTIRFAVRQQKFLEALETSNTKKALAILRTELAPLNHDAGRLHLLSSWLMCSSPEDLRQRANWDGVAGESRDQLLSELQKHISPSLMIPRRRMATLLEQAKDHQRSQCVFHAADATISLLSDCNCDPSWFPSVTTHILKDHTDEIWRLEFSHNGEWLATAGRDCTAMLWRVKTGFTLDKVFRDHSDPVCCIAWSPDDSILLTAAEATIKMWNTATGACINTLKEHAYSIGALAWMPDGRHFVSGGMDSRVWLWDIEGNVTSLLPSTPSRVLDLAVSPDGKLLVVAGRVDINPRDASRSGSVSVSRGGTPAPTPPIMPRHEKRISVFNLVEKKLEYEITQPGELTSVTISADSRFALLSHAPGEILYVDLRDGTIVRRYLGAQSQEQFVVQSCYGGALQNYIISGSGEGTIYIWHRDTTALLHVLKGHGGGSVNAVAWNPAHPAMFASASDDRTVRIWGVPPPRGVREGKRPS